MQQIQGISSVFQPALSIKAMEAAQIPEILPHEKVYTLLVGDERFRLSGASLSYDSPSYFTDYFLSNVGCTNLSIDRSPSVFRKICSHLQGYSIKIEDEYEFVYLLMDANYFRLKKLRERLLLEPFHISVGGKKFKIPKEILSTKGNHPNFFSILYNTMMTDPFANTDSFIRPPALIPYDSNKSAANLEQLLHGLYGNTIKIESEQHREDLLADCRYYQFFGLEQKLIKHQIIKNPFTKREEIVIGYKDIKRSGLLNDTMNSMIDANAPFTIVKYSRPFIDENVYRDLVIQLDSSEVSLMVNAGLRFASLLVTGKTALTLKNLLSQVTDDYIYEKENQIHKLTVLITMNNSVGTLNGLKMEQDWLKTLMEVNNNTNTNILDMNDINDINNVNNVNDNNNNNNKDFHTNNNINDINIVNNNNNNNSKVIVIKLLKSQWTINVQGRSKIWMNGLKFEGLLDDVQFNNRRDFL